MAERPQRQPSGRDLCDFSAEMQCVRTDLYGLFGIRSSGLRRNESDIASGSRIYCGGYAASARGSGNYGAYVSGGVRSCVYRSIPDSVHACQQRYQFLFPADRKSGDRIGKPLCI